MGEAYEKGILIVPIVMLAYIFYGIYTHFVIGIYLKKKTYYLPFITGLGAIVNVAANLLLIPLFTISGAAWATFLAYFVMAFSLFWVNRRLYFIPYEYIRLLKLVVIFVLLFWAGYIWGRDFTFLIRLIILLSFFPLLYVFRFFYSDERRFLRKLIPEL